MKGLIVALGDRLQATFPPNRVAILLAGPIVAASAWISGVVASNVPGVELPKGVIAGVMGAAVLIVIRLLDRWFDQWQKGEPIHVDADLSKALDELADSPDVHSFYRALGTLETVEHVVAEIRPLAAGAPAAVITRLDSLAVLVDEFLSEHLERPAPEAAVGTLKNPAPAPAVPTKEAQP